MPKSRNLNVTNITFNAIRENKILAKISDSTVYSMQTYACVSVIFLQHALSGVTINGPRREKTCLRGFANNTGADQPAHTRSLISAFVIRFK